MTTITPKGVVDTKSLKLWHRLRNLPPPTEFWTLKVWKSYGVWSKTSLRPNLTQKADFFYKKIQLTEPLYSCPNFIECMYLSLHPLGWAHSLWRFLGPQMGLLFFEFELKPTGKDSADPTQHEFQHHIV